MKLHPLLLGGALSLALPLAAQDLESFAGMRFHFESPGARSAAMGGASEALAGDVSSNPASLAKVRERRVQIDARRGTNENEFLTGGTVGSFQTDRYESSSSGITAASVILPTRAATFALFVDEPMRSSLSTTGIPHGEHAAIRVGVRNGQLVPWTDCPAPGDTTQLLEPCVFGYYDTPALMRADARVALRRIGGTMAFARGPVSFGASAQYAHLDEHVRTFGITNRSDDSALTWSAGAQWEISPVIRAGASYHSGARFDAERTFDQPVAGGEVRSFNTPSSYGAGLAFDVAPNVTFAVDAKRVRYSEMLEGVNPFTQSPYAIWPYVMADVTELHAGAEVRLPARVPVAVRAGWWRDPAHRMRVKGYTEPWAHLVNLALLDEDQNHITAGIGVGDRVRVEAAIDRSEHTTRGSLTLATTF